MIEAWVIRSIERQKLLEELMRMVYELEDKSGAPILFELAHVLIDYFRAKKENLFNDFLLANAISTHGEVYELIFKEILPKIESFARAKEEEDALVADLLKKILETSLTPFHSALMGLEIHNPQLIFNAPSAMTEKELSDEE